MDFFEKIASKPDELKSSLAKIRSEEGWINYALHFIYAYQFKASMKIRDKILFDHRWKAIDCLNEVYFSCDQKYKKEVETSLLFMLVDEIGGSEYFPKDKGKLDEEGIIKDIHFSIEFMSVGINESVIINELLYYTPTATLEQVFEARKTFKPILPSL